MSSVNLIANLIAPQYSTVFMVRTEKMEKIEERLGKKFEGVVAELEPDQVRKPIQRSKASKLLSVVIAILSVAAPYCIIASLTKFNRGNSTRAQRGWTMSWLVMSQVFGFGFGWLGGNLKFGWVIWTLFRPLDHCVPWSKREPISLDVLSSSFMERTMANLILGAPVKRGLNVLPLALRMQAIPSLIVAVPMIGGFVVVGQMLAAHGTCSS
jgi:hypothetical protein